MTCRRCSECAESDHHWLENPGFGAEDDDCDSPTGVPFVCKHCEAVGDYCPGCGDDFESEDCPTCDGSGIVPCEPMSYEEMNRRMEEGR